MRAGSFHHGVNPSPRESVWATTITVFHSVLSSLRVSSDVCVKFNTFAKADFMGILTSLPPITSMEEQVSTSEVRAQVTGGMMIFVPSTNY